MSRKRKRYASAGEGLDAAVKDLEAAIADSIKAGERLAIARARLRRYSKRAIGEVLARLQTGAREKLAELAGGDA